MNETAKGAAQSAADESVYARLEKDLTAVKNDVAHLSQQISEAVNALGAVAQRQARRGLRNAGQRGHVGVAAMGQGSGRGPVDQSLDAGDGLAAAPVSHQDRIALGPRRQRRLRAPAAEMWDRMWDRLASRSPSISNLLGERHLLATNRSLQKRFSFWRIRARPRRRQPPRVPARAAALPP